MRTLASAGDWFLFLGVLLFCCGTMLGIPHGRSKRRKELKRTELWRVAHLSTCVGGVSLIALSLALERLFGANAMYTLALFAASAYSFFLACTLSASLNIAWDDDRTQLRVLWVYRLQILASVLAVLAVLAFPVTFVWNVFL